MANTLKFGNGNWATKEGSTLAYNDENGNFKPLPFDLSRASKATVVNKDGLIEEVGSGEPRIDYKDNTKGALLLEPQRTNLVEYSIPTNSAPYNYANGGVALAPIHTANQGISPDGSLNASKIDFNLNGGTTSSDLSQMAYVGSSLTGDYTSSFYLKSFDSNSYIVTLLDSNGATSQETITPEWQRFTFYNGGGTTSTNLIRIRLRGNENTSNTASLLAWGFQLEEGSYATSAIFTSGSTVTRVADVCNNGGNEQVFNDSEGVLMVEINGLSDLDDTRYVTLNEKTSSVNRLSIQYRNSGELRLYNGGTSTAQMIYRDSSANLTENLKIAIKYGTTSSSYKVYINGISKTIESAFVATAMSGLDNLKFTDINGSGSPFLGRIKQIQYCNTALTDQELIALTQV